MGFRVRMVRATMIVATAMVFAACGDEDPEESQATIAPGNRAPVISGTPATTIIENEFYDFTPAASDPDGDPINFGIDGMPAWLEFDTSIGRLFGTPGVADIGTHRGIDIWVTDGTDASSLPRLTISVQAASSPNRAPQISGAPAGSITAGNFYDFIPVASDSDGDPLTFSIENRPVWAVFDPQIGRLSGTPGSGDIGSYGNVVISVTDGIATTVLDPFVIVVNPAPSQNSPPTISGQPPSSVVIGNAYSFTPTASDVDQDSLNFSAINLPGWAQIDSGSGALSGSPGPSDVGFHNGISIVVSDGQAQAALPSFSIEVIDPNSPPTISGSPADTVTAGDAYSFTPTANDSDGDTLSFTISGGPSWSRFNGSNGALTGTPGAGDVGTYNNIRITVSDGSAAATLGPFSIEVVAFNSPPSISGTPASNSLAGQSYVFVPTATDPDGDALTFSISGQPTWVSFDSGNGALTGTPGPGDVGSYTDILITVSDGQVNATLGPFSINVTATASGTAALSWLPPTENADGSPLADLTGFIVYWGTSPGNYPNSVTLNNPGLTTYVVDNLLSGTTYYFSTTALNSAGLESSLSNVASKTIP